MGTGYWIAEYTKVFLAYIFLMFVYPSILFRSYLHGKSKAFWFSFCVSVQTVLLSTVVLMMGVLHILNIWTIRILFYGSLIWSISKTIQFRVAPRYLVYKFGNHTYTSKLFVLHLGEMLGNIAFRAFNAVWQRIKKNCIEVFALSALILYALIYFTIGAFNELSYGFGDLYVHHAWIYGLIQGKVFSAGIYPEGMHAFIYLFHALFNIRIYSVMLFMQCVHVAVFLLAAYLLIRECFCWKYTGILMLTAFLTVKLMCVNEVYSMSRLQWVLPQEFGMPMAFTIPTFLIRYLRNGASTSFHGKKSRFYWDENLVVFFFGIAASFTTHFYSTIMAVFTCAAVVIVWFSRVINWRRLIPLGISAVLAILLASVPMAVAFVEGVPFEKSIYWAVNVMNGVYDDTGATTIIRQDPSQKVDDGTNVSDLISAVIDAVSDDEGNAQQQPQGQTQGVDGVAVPQKPRATVKEIVVQYFQALKAKILRNVHGIYRGGFLELYGNIWGPILLVCTGLAMFITLGYRFWNWIWNKKKGSVTKKKYDGMDGYAIIAMTAFVYIVIYSAPNTDFPSIIAGSRLCSITHALMMALFVLPLDIVGIFLSRRIHGWTLQFIAVAEAAVLFAGIVCSGYYHSYLYFELTRYPSVVELTNSIIGKFPKDEFTIVSTTDELYQIIQNGFHEEYLSFLGDSTKADYYIPTRYVFFYLEKHPILYAQIHFADGPAWLAKNDYFSYLTQSVSQCPDISKGEISEENARMEDIFITRLQSEAYTELYNRQIIESSAWLYLQSLEEKYPNEMKKYYEDDDFVCYCLEQNPARLYNLLEREP